MAMIQDDVQTYTAIVQRHRERDEARQRAAQEAEEAAAAAATEQERQEVKQTDQKLFCFRRRDAGNRRDDQRNETFFDWSFWGLFICFAIMSYARIRLEPARRRAQRRTLAQMALNDQGNAVQTLRRINRDREARGETPISLEAYRTLRMVLLQDRLLLQGLAGQNVPPPQRGATQEQLEICRHFTIRGGDDYEGECCICLAPFQANDQVRILPCSHSYHKSCIDQWFEQSILCPICKQSLGDGVA
jgi:hypothetical protein